MKRNFIQETVLDIYSSKSSVNESTDYDITTKHYNEMDKKKFFSELIKLIQKELKFKVKLNVSEGGYNDFEVGSDDFKKECGILAPYLSEVKVKQMSLGTIEIWNGKTEIEFEMIVEFNFLDKMQDFDIKIGTFTYNFDRKKWNVSK